MAIISNPLTIVGGVNYSTTEKEIGTWIDGNTLYEKTLVITDFTGYADKTINISLSDLGVPSVSYIFLHEGHLQQKIDNPTDIGNILHVPSYDGKSGDWQTALFVNNLETLRIRTNFSTYNDFNTYIAKVILVVRYTKS